MGCLGARFISTMGFEEVATVISAKWAFVERGALDLCRYEGRKSNWLWTKRVIVTERGTNVE